MGKGTATIIINNEPKKPTTFEDLGYVKVVRCKDCKHGEKCVPPYTDYLCSKLDYYFSPDWFCAYGEKRENE